MDKDYKSRTKFWKGVLVGALVTAFAGLIIVGVATGISVIGRTVIDNQQTQMETVGSTEGPAGEAASKDAASGEASSAPISLDMQEMSNKIGTLQEIVNEYYLFDKDSDQVQDGMYKGMMMGLGDPYTVYYTPEEYASLMEETEGVYCGIGVLVSQNMQSGVITAIRVFKGSPAEEAGMKRGDILYKVGDVEAATKELDVLVKEDIRGEEGTYVDITVIRDGEEVKLNIQRRIVEVTTVEGKMLDEETGYILVTQFELVTGDQFKQMVEELEAQGMKQLVIDLRDNPGGILDSCVDMAAYILPDDQWNGTLISTSDKYGKGERYYSSDGKIRHAVNDGGGLNPQYPKLDEHELNMPIAVLINGQSASASEVFAGALRDYGKATLVGTTSFGKGIVQSVFPLYDGSGVKLTTSHYYTPSGYDLHKKGLEPDVEVELVLDEELRGQYDIPVEKDNQLQKAIEVLNGQQKQ